MMVFNGRPWRTEGWPARPPATGPAEELDGVLQRLSARLDVLAGPGCAAAAAGPPTACLDELYGYLVEDLGPVLVSLSERVRPALRRAGAFGPGTRAAEEHARLLRLTERVAAFRDAYTLGGDPTRLRDLAVALVDECAALATAHLLRARDTLPAALRTVPPELAVQIVDTARRTARVIHDRAQEPEPALQ